MWERLGQKEITWGRGKVVRWMRSVGISVCVCTNIIISTSKSVIVHIKSSQHIDQKGTHSIAWLIYYLIQTYHSNKSP